jgi:hypothetical protein
MARATRALREAERLRAASAALAARCGTEPGGAVPSLPKPGLPQFEIRGKAGAAF